jgi:hypothetical protein
MYVRNHMSILHTSLFAPATFGVGFHNVGIEGVLRASNETMVKKVQHYYGERCGHLPLNATNIRALVDFPSDDIRAQMAYLSALVGKDVLPVTFDELKKEAARATEQTPFVVPYINLPELETRLHNELGAASWGLPGTMTNVLKNKASFYQFTDEIGLQGFYPPDYTIANIFDVAQEAERFLRRIEEIYKEVGVAGSYPSGVVLRAAEEDGNYGCCVVYEDAGGIIVIPNGDADHAHRYRYWREALASSQEHLLTTMNIQKEMRVVMSRYIDFVDSPGMSVVIMDDQVVSLGWNGQLQMPGSKACVGTSTYMPKSAYMQRMQQEYEAQTAAFFEALLRRTAQKCGIDFGTIRGVANLDIMMPGELEKRLQRARKQPAGNYLAECNPRWTNYTDAIMTVLGANHKEQTIYNMQEVIQAGICTFDKYPLPEGIDPQRVRACIAERDAVAKQDGTRIICRMAKNPMGLIFAGDVARAQQEVDEMLMRLSPDMQV